MMTLGEDGLAKVKAGVTTPEELLRVVTEVREMRTLCPRLCGAPSASTSWPARTAATASRRGCGKCGRALQTGWTVLPVLRVDAGAAPTKKRLREPASTLELPLSNVAEFKNAGR